MHREQSASIVGITGNPSSGKDTIARHFEEKGFFHISLGDLLRSEMKKNKIPFDRAHMHDFAIEMRKKRGSGYLAEEVVEMIAGNTVVSGLRNIEEVKILRERFGARFTLLSVEAPLEIRYEWSKGRGRQGDFVSFEQFKKQEEMERHGNLESQHVDDVVRMADFNIKNDNTKEKLLENAGIFLEHLLKEESAKKILTLCLIHNDTQILLGMKKRGFGAGKWNGFGGKVEAGESVAEGARRELSEECGLDVAELEEAGIMHFYFEGNPEILEVHVFRGVDYSGEIIETEEMLPRWFNRNEIPFDEMWQDDKHWMPLFFEKKRFFGKFIFDRNNELRLTDIRAENFL